MSAQPVTLSSAGSSSNASSSSASSHSSHASEPNSLTPNSPEAAAAATAATARPQDEDRMKDQDENTENEDEVLVDHEDDAEVVRGDLHEDDAEDEEDAEEDDDDDDDDGFYDEDDADDDSTDGHEDLLLSSSTRILVPSMRHGGCINTAAWLDCGWRLSATAGSGSNNSNSSVESFETEECPTQLITSGDDHLVKFWDVRQALGMANPLRGGNCTINPFSAPKPALAQEAIRNSWRDYYKARPELSNNVSGSVLPLATLHTNHRGNVFHVTPLEGQAGKVATCGADGYLRMTNLETGDASIIVSPEYDEDHLGGLFPAGLLSLRASMCFSHHFLNRNTGLLCSERGLRRFDLRLPPREQPSQSVMGGPFRACKACAIWSSAPALSLEQGDSAYVFGAYRILSEYVFLFSSCGKC
jgi:hypothetical protein